MKIREYCTLAILVTLTAFVIVVLFGADKAECAWCPSTICFNDAGCPSSCACFIPPAKMSGSCYGVGIK